MRLKAVFLLVAITGCSSPKVKVVEEITFTREMRENGGAVLVASRNPSFLGLGYDITRLDLISVTPPDGPMVSISPGIVAGPGTLNAAGGLNGTLQTVIQGVSNVETARAIRPNQYRSTSQTTISDGGTTIGPMSALAAPQVSMDSHDSLSSSASPVITSDLKMSQQGGNTTATGTGTGGGGGRGGAGGAGGTGNGGRVEGVNAEAGAGARAGSTIEDSANPTVKQGGQRQGQEQGQNQRLTCRDDYHAPGCNHRDR